MSAFKSSAFKSTAFKSTAFKNTAFTTPVARSWTPDNDDEEVTYTTLDVQNASIDANNGDYSVDDLEAADD